MAIINSGVQSVSLSSKITVNYDQYIEYSYRTSNTATDSRTFSVSVPSGAVVSAATFYFTQNSTTTYGGTAKVNGTVYTSGSYSIALGAVSSATVSFYWKSKAVDGSGNPKASVTQTISWTNCYIAVDYYYPYSACGAPTAVSTPSNVAPSTDHTLSWSGATGGTSNGISGYQVYRSTSPTTGYAALGGKVVTTAASGSMTVTSHATSGSIYYYKVATYGSVAGYDSGVSSAYATLKTLVTAPSAPTSISTPTDVAPGSTQSLTWSGASDGTNNTILKYHIYRSDDGGANYTYLAEDTASPLSVTSSPDNGGTYYYKIYTIGERGNSDISSVFASLKTTVGMPGVPTTVTVENGASVAPGKTRTLSWSGASAGTNNAIKGYQVHRSVNGDAYAYLADVLTTATSGSLVVDAASAAATYTYKVLVLGNTLSVNSALSSVYGTLKTETVPSTGTLSAASVVATGGNKIGITIVPQAETSYTHQVIWSIPSTSYTSGTISLPESDLYDEFTVPSSWINATTKTTTSVTAQCRIETFLGTTSIGTNVYTFVVNVPPKSTISLSEGVVTANGTDKKTVTIAPAYSGYSHKVTWTTEGYASAVTSILSGTNTADFAVPLDWNNASPNNTSFLVTCTVETFKDTMDGSLSLGSNFKIYTVNVPSTIVPVITSFTATPVDAYWGLYVKTKSRCTLTPVAQAAYSSPIVSYQIVGATQNSGTLPYVTGTDWTTAPLQVHGDPITFTLSITDGRQRTATATVSIVIADYASPSIQGVTFSRANASGTLHNQGTYINAKATFTYSAIGSNAIAAKAYYRQLGSISWLPAAGADILSNTILTYGDGNIAQGYLYDVKIALSDYFSTVEHTAMVAKAVKVWDIREDRAAFGAFATNPKELYVPAAWDIKVGTENINIPFVVGTQTATTASWTGIAGNVKELYNGLTIRYWLPRTSASNVTLNLTLADSTTTGAIPVYYGGTTRLTTHYAAGSMLVLTYVVNQLINGVAYTGWWADANYDSNTYDRMHWGAPITAGVPIYSYKLLMQAANGKWYPLTLNSGTGTNKIVSQVEVLPQSPILYYDSTTTVPNGNTTTAVYSEFPVTTLSYTANQTAWTSQMPIYLKGTITPNGNFQLDATSYTSFMTQTLPTTQDGFVYILLGYMSSSTSLRLHQYHPIYEFKGGGLKPYSGDVHIGSSEPSGGTGVWVDTDEPDVVLTLQQLGAAPSDYWRTIYPIGAIYMSVVSTSPMTLFGGTWEALGGYFLIGANGTYAAGSTGGAAAHMLTDSEIPFHRHTITSVYDDGNYNIPSIPPSDGKQSIPYDAGTIVRLQYTDYTGGGLAHNNMPPFLSVYMWKRTA